MSNCTNHSTCNTCNDCSNDCGSCDARNTRSGCDNCSSRNTRSSCDNCSSRNTRSGCDNCSSRNTRSGCDNCNNCGDCNGCSGSWNWNNRSGCDNCSNWDWNNWNNWNNWNWGNWNNWMNWNWNPWWNNWNSDRFTCNRWAQPIFSNPAQFSNAGVQNGATLVIHKIVLEPCGNTTCTPRTFNIRITGPSYPCGEVFRLRAGSCLELDEPLVITGLEPGTYCIEELFNCPNEYISTFTGPVCGRKVNVTNSWFPTVITICSRKRLCRLCHGFGCGCGACCTCQ